MSGCATVDLHLVRANMWAVFYDDVPRRRRCRDPLPEQIANLGREMADVHLACTDIAPQVPPARKTIKKRAIHLLDLLESPSHPATSRSPPESYRRAVAPHPPLPGAV